MTHSMLGIRLKNSRPSSAYTFASVVLVFYIISIFAFSFGENTLAISEAIAFLLIMVFFAESTSKRLEINIFPQFFPALLFVFWSALGVFWSIDESIALTKVITLVQLLGLSIISTNIMVSNRNIYPALVGIILGACWAVGKSLIESNFRLIQTDVNYRAVASLANPNAYGLLLAIATMACLYLIQNTKRARLRLILVFIVAIFILQSIFYTGSLKSIISLGIIGLIFYGMNISNMSRRTVIYSFIVSLIILVLYPRINELYPYHRRWDLESSYSYGERIRLINYGLDLWQQRPLIGFGPNQFTVLYGKWYSHNNYIEILANHGMIGFLFYYFIYAACIYNLIFLLLKFKIPYPLGVWALGMILWILVVDYASISYYGKYLWIVISVLISLINIYKPIGKLYYVKS